MALHTDIPTRSQIERLLTARGPSLVSIYVPTSPITQETRGDRIAFKNLVSTAVEQLRAAGTPAHDVNAVDEGLQDLHDDDEFWVRQANSLAVFASPRGVRTFRLPNRLTEAVQVADRYYVKPLLRAVSFPQAAFVLALAEGSVRVLEVTADVPTFELHVPDLPTDVASAVGKASITDRGATGRIQGSEGKKVLIRQYARLVDHALRSALAGHHLPLILAATQPIESIFRSVNTYPELVDEGIEGSPEHRSDAELAADARTVLDAVHAAELEALKELFETRLSQGRGATDVTDVARAATFGAVDTVLVDIDATLPGVVDEESGAVTIGEDDGAAYGVIDEIARRALLFGGRVLAVRSDDIPEGGPVAAILRYPA
jgi:Bacterial archaeo-eukaryotic release factor family 11